MTLAISNIAWPADEEQEVAAALQNLGVTAVEIAPTKVFADPLDVSDVQLRDYLSFWADNGIEVVAFQSMLFGRLDLELFGAPTVRSATADYLRRFIELAGRMGARVLVFGSPKNRLVPEGMTSAEADDIAAAFFDELGTAATENGTTFCIEPNPTAYECNYVVDAASGTELVRRVGNPGFGLHLDAAGMTLAGDDVAESIHGARDLLNHFHVSAPYLQPVETVEVDHRAAAAALEEIGFEGFTSIEMRPGAAGESVERVVSAVGIARTFYAR